MRILAFRVREALRGSLWFLPSLFVAGAVVLWIVMAFVDRHVNGDDVPLTYGGGPVGATEVLSAISTSMIAFTGVVFSISIVVLQLASGQFSPRVLRTFLRDRTTQSSLGIFIATFVYALLVLLDVRVEADGPRRVPELSVTMAPVVLAVSLGVFVYYIHHIAQSIRVAWIIERVADETRAVIDHVFPERADDEGSDDALPHGGPTQIIGAPAPGILLAIDKRRLVEIAEWAGCVFVVEPSVGDFLPARSVLLSVHGAELGGRGIEDALEATAIGVERTMEQDPAFGFRQLVDIAVRALSPAVNDPTTAVQCLDQLHDLLRRLATRPFRSGRLVDHNGVLRVVVPPPSWDDFLDLALDEIRHYGTGSIQVTRRIRSILDDLRELSEPARHEAIDRQAAMLDRAVEHGFADPDERRLAGRPDRQGLGSTVTG